MKIKLLASGLLMAGAFMAPGFAVGQVLPLPTEAWATLYDNGPIASSINGNIPLSGSGYIAPTNTITTFPFGTGTLAGGFLLPAPNINTLVNEQETSTGVGGIIGHIHYDSTLGFNGFDNQGNKNAGLAVGQVFSENFNIYEPSTIIPVNPSDPNAEKPSDTLNIVFIGLDPVTNDGSNLSIDFHFLSENDVLSLTALTAGGLLPPGFIIGPHNIYEGPNGPGWDGMYNDVTSIISNDVATLNGLGANIGTNDLHVRFTSVPEPTTTALLFAGLAGMGMIRRRKNKNS